MLDINRDINSLSNFKRHTPDFIRQLKETGEPVVLTVNGKAEIVVQDSASYQRLLERAERAERMDSLKKSVQEMKDGLSIPAEDVLAEMLKVLNTKKAE